LGRRRGYRNAQATVIAATGTIGLVMDCDITGIKPDFALVKFDDDRRLKCRSHAADG
jgi:ribonucleoside-diphosphate reductase alpha chain